jgi:transcriptional regulator with GAF, ATPase, and Fis domain
MSADARAKALSALARFQVTDTSVGDTLQSIAEITLEAIPAAAVAGLTMLGDDGQPTTAVYTDVLSPEVDEAQYRHGKGPCLDAWRERHVLRIDRMEDVAAKYPGFVAACVDHEVRSTLSMPIVGGEVSMGALNLYAHTAAAFDADAETVGAELAGAAGAVLANVSAYWTAFELSQNLDQAMRSRAVIQQAKGMLMAQSAGLSADAAFDLLRKASQRENVKLRDIAQRIVDRRPAPESHGDDDS